MRIFISYSVSDTRLVRAIAHWLRPHAEIFFWDKSREPGQDAWKSIFDWIDGADLVLAVITGNTVNRAMAVGQEIGHAKSRHKLIVPIITDEVPPAELGRITGVIYQRIDRSNPAPAFHELRKLVISHKQKQEAKTGLLLLVGGIFALLLANQANNEEDRSARSPRSGRNARR